MQPLFATYQAIIEARVQQQAKWQAEVRLQELIEKSIAQNKLGKELTLLQPAIEQMELEQPAEKMLTLTNFFNEHSQDDSPLLAALTMEDNLQTFDECVNRYTTTMRESFESKPDYDILVATTDAAKAVLKLNPTIEKIAAMTIELQAIHDKVEIYHNNFLENLGIMTKDLIRDLAQFRNARLFRHSGYYSIHY